MAESTLERTVWVDGTGNSFRVDVKVGPFALVGDVGPEYGGKDTAPNPYDYLLISLGTCTAMTLRLYADQKGLPLAGVSVRLTHEKIHAADCATCETKEGKIDRIDRTVALDGPLDAAQRARLLEIADKCPVHRTLTSEVEIRTALAS